MTMTTMGLATIYAKYFVHDFSKQVMSNIKGSHPLSEAALESAIEKKLAVTPELSIQASNSVTRFVHECADFALKNGYEDPTAVETWNEVAALPSVYHGDINTLAFQSADLYRKTFDNSVMNVVVRDAYTASQKITNDAQARIEQTETGGEMHRFSWGILNDGLWLNGALMKAFDIANIFRPGEKTQALYARVAFDFAQQKAISQSLDKDQQMSAYGETDLLVSTVTDPEFVALLAETGQNTLNSLLFTSGSLTNAVRRWELGLNDPTMLVGAVDEMSKIARLLQSLSTAQAHMEDPSLISETTTNRLNALNDVVTLCLVGYEALRNTKYNDSLIMSVIPLSQDNKVDVIVNDDTFTSYASAGGEEKDFVQFGLYLDPRRGMSMPSNGYSLEFILGRRDDVLPQIMAEDADRLSVMRSNDARVIEDLTNKTLRDVTLSYCKAKGLEALQPGIQQKIYAIGRSVVRPSENFALESGIMDLLMEVLDEPLVTTMGQHFKSHIGAADKTAPALTILDQALDDAISYVTTVDIVPDELAA